MVDTRLIGKTSENIFLSLVNQRGIFATSFDTAAFDGIAFDEQNDLFQIGHSPFYFQIKCRGSTGNLFHPQGHSPRVINAIQTLAQRLNIPETSLYFVVGFFKSNDVRNIIFFGIPFAELRTFKVKEQYRFSVQHCEQVVKQIPGMFRL